MQEQLAAELLPYLSAARQRGHGVTIVMMVLPDGKLGSPKITVDTRGDKRTRPIA